MVRFESFNRHYGLYRPEYLSSPRLFDMMNIEFPTGSVLHYLPENDVDWGPEPTWWMIRKVNADIWVDHVLTFETPFGKTTPLTGNPTQFIRKYHQRFPGLKKVLKLETAISQMSSTLVVNHALARHYIKYQGTQFVEYSRNRNQRDNIFSMVGRMVKTIDRHHFIPVRMPSSFPTLSQIQKAAGEEILSADSVKRFTSLERLMFLEIWRWLGDPGEVKGKDGKPMPRGVLSKILEMPQDKLTHINFVFYVRNNWMLVNLADLYSVRKTEANPKGKYEGEQLQKRFLNGIVNLVEAGVVAEKKPEESSDLDRPAESNEPLTNQEIQNHNEVVLSTVTVSKEISSKIEKNQPKTLAAIGVANSQGTTVLPLSVEQEVAAKEQAVQEKERSEASSAALQAGKVSTELTDEEIDANLEALEKVNAIQNGDDFATPHNPNADPLEEGILSRGRALAKDGVILGPELRRIEALAVAYKKIKNPYGPGLLHEAAVVTKEETIVKPAEYKVKGPIFDPSMTASAVREANRRYVKTTLQKDLVNSVLAFQRTGTAVTGFEVEKSKNVLGEKDILSIRMQPIGGVPSTVRVIVPVIDEEGVFKSGGTRYRMRTQRGDVPIRKVAPTKVSITSYAGKISVALSERATHNYGRWLTDEISALSMQEKSPIKEVHFTNVFDRKFRAPKAYTRLAHSVHTLEVGNLLMTFKQSDRLVMVDPAVVAKLEVNGTVVIGITKDKQPITMDVNNIIWAKGVSLGTIEAILELDASNAPHQMATIRVRGQNIPLGVVLANYHGLSNLIAMLKATTRRVISGDRMQLQPWEYPVRFSDESLILDTRESLAMMLLSGFRYYHKEIRQISIYSFDQKPAYGMLLDAKSRNGAYTVELELLDDAFLDPMTIEVLKEMGEPTEWRPLLMRAARLLLTDYAPEEVDGAFMLLKGYERVPGAVYRELYIAHRQYKLRSRVTKTSIDMKPTQVWNTFTADSAISPVNDCNPIADLRSSEAITYIGNGGRSKRSMVARTRKFHENDMGVISEATVDSGDVGINIYMTANPQIISTRGLTKSAPNADVGTASMVSTSAMLSPGADIDDQIGN